MSWQYLTIFLSVYTPSFFGIKSYIDLMTLRKNNFVSPLFLSAVQHERGPRKPKHKSPDHGPHLSLPQPPPVPPVPMLPSSDGPIDLRVAAKLDAVHHHHHHHVPNGAMLDHLPQPTFLHSLLAAEQYHESPFTATRLVVNEMGGVESSAFRVPHSMAGESLQEVTARLLFSIVNWIKHIPSFRALPARDQVSKPPT